MISGDGDIDIHFASAFLKIICNADRVKDFCSLNARNVIMNWFTSQIYHYFRQKSIFFCFVLRYAKKYFVQNDLIDYLPKIASLLITSDLITEYVWVSDSWFNKRQIKIYLSPDALSIENLTINFVKSFTNTERSNRAPSEAKKCQFIISLWITDLRCRKKLPKFIIAVQLLLFAL